MNTCLGYIQFTKSHAVKHVTTKRKVNSAEDYIREKKIMRKINGTRGVVGLDEEAEEKYKSCKGCLDHIVMPLCNGGDLYDHVMHHVNKGYYRKGHENFVQGLLLKKYIVDLLDIVVRVHEQGVAHLDISPENLCLHDGKLVLIDFGNARDVVRPRVLVSALTGKPAYRAPELGDEGFHGVEVDPFKIDVYTVGLVLYILATGNMLFTVYKDENWWYYWRKRAKLKACFKYMLKKLGGFHDDLFVDLLARALEFYPEERATMGELVNHPFVQSLKKTKK